MGLAPSEKHLENWIVNNFEEFNEESTLQQSAQFRRIVGRQLRFPSGIADLVLAGKLTLWVIELKKGVVDGDAVSQLNHYMCDINREHQWMLSHIEDDGLHNHSWNYEDRTGTPLVRGMVIGKSFERHAWLACEGLDIRKVQYDFDGDTYRFTHEPHSPFCDVDIDLHSDVISALRETMRHIYLLENDKESLKILYKSEGWMK